MAAKPPLPSIGDDLAPRRRVDLRAIQPNVGLDDNEVDANSRTLGGAWGASTSLGGSASQPESAVQPAPSAPPAPVASLRIEIPVYLDDELRVKAAGQGVTKQYLVMQALSAAGYHITPSDLVADRRRRRGKP